MVLQYEYCMFLTNLNMFTFIQALTFKVECHWMNCFIKRKVNKNTSPEKIKTIKSMYA